MNQLVQGSLHVTLDMSKNLTDYFPQVNPSVAVSKDLTYTRKMLDN